MISCKRREVAAKVVIAWLNFFQDEADVKGLAAIGDLRARKSDKCMAESTARLVELQRDSPHDAR